MTFVKIKRVRVTKVGMRGNQVTIPKLWMVDNAIGEGDYLEIHQNEFGGLLIVKEGMDPQPELSRVKAGGTQLDASAFQRVQA